MVIDVEWLQVAVYAAYRQFESVEDVGSLRLLPQRHVQADGCGKRRLPIETHELSVPLLALQGYTEVLS